MGRTLNRLQAIALYGLMLAASVAAFFAIRAVGEGLTAGAPPEAVSRFGNAGTVAGPGDFFHLLLALAAVILVGQALAWLFAAAGQPPVIGEVAAGIALGPSLLGWLWPKASAFLLPPALAPLLGAVAQLGIVLYMFVVGLELSATSLARRGRSAVAISHASILVPFVLGALLALFLYPRLASSDVPFTPFALFLGVSLAVTAFPVLARILTDRNMHQTPLGVLALACAAADDVTAWCLLALVVGVAQSAVGEALGVFAWTLAYLGVMFLLVRPLLAKVLHKQTDESVARGALALAFVGLLASALATEWIGIHAIFGAFLLGAIIPHKSALARTLASRLTDLVTVLLLPAFFALTGMRTQIGLVHGLEAWLLCGLIIGVATLGKFGGTLAAARLTGLSWRDGTALGVLMNTRGLMELIVLNVGLDLGVISPTLFAMLVLMALATTIATSPVLAVLKPDGLAETA